MIAMGCFSTADLRSPVFLTESPGYSAVLSVVSVNEEHEGVSVPRITDVLTHLSGC